MKTKYDVILSALREDDTPAVTSSVYHVFLTQASTGAPTIAILQDTITGVARARSAMGTYTLTKAGAFTQGKTTPGAQVVVMYDNSGNKITAEWTSADVITVKTYAAADTTVLADNILNATEFKIEVFV